MIKTVFSALVAAFVLVACGGGDDAPAACADDRVTIPEPPYEEALHRRPRPDPKMDACL